MNQKDLLNAALRKELSLFIQKVFHTVSPGDEFLSNWHIDAIAYALERCMNGEIKRLIITMPPRHLKSISASVALPACLLGRNPAEQIICVSYAHELALKHAADTRLVMSSDWYQEVFPGAALSLVKDTQSKLQTNQNGFRLATSVGGALTGLGGNFIIIDDPHKADEVISDTQREKVINWFMQTAMTRLNNKKEGVVIVIQQRLHQADLAGVLLDQGGWHHLNLTARAEQDETIPIGPNLVYSRKCGDILHPERESSEDLMQRALEMGDYAYAAQYQQRPSPLGGGIVKLDWFRRHTKLKHLMHAEHIVQSWDIAVTADKLSDWTVCTTWYAIGGKLYLVDVLREKLEFPKLKSLIFSQAKKYSATDVIIEAVGAGQALYLQVQHEIFNASSRPFLLHCEKPKEDKATRLMAESPEIESGRVYLPESAPWLDSFEKELLNFPNGLHDDQVDSLTMFLRWDRFRYRSKYKKSQQSAVLVW